MDDRTIRAVAGTVRGRVQGVGFRWFVRERARSLGLTGWVMNNPDGTVAFAAAGPAEQVERLLTAVRRGPPAAQVADVVVHEVAAHEAADDPFAVRR